MRKLILTVLVILMVLSLITVRGAADSRAQNKVQLTRLEGKVHYKTKKLLFFSSGWQQVEETVVLTDGDKLKTNDNSQAELEFPNQARVLIKDKSKLELVKADTGELKLKKIKLTLGEVVVKVIDQLETENPFQVETPSAVAGVKGTTFRVKVTKRKATQVAVKTGTVEVSSQAGSVDVSNGQLAEVVGKNKPPQVKPQSKEKEWKQEEKWLEKTEKWAEKAKERAKEKRAEQAKETPPGLEKKEEAAEQKEKKKNKNKEREKNRKPEKDKNKEEKNAQPPENKSSNSNSNPGNSGGNPSNPGQGNPGRGN